MGVGSRGSPSRRGKWSVLKSREPDYFLKNPHFNRIVEFYATFLFCSMRLTIPSFLGD
jgi:DNA phosphorothioation-dependent restriction protein DptG